MYYVVTIYHIVIKYFFIHFKHTNILINKYFDRLALKFDDNFVMVLLQLLYLVKILLWDLCAMDLY